MATLAAASLGPYVKKDKTYKDLLRAGARCGLYRLATDRHVAKHRGKTLYNGAFAVKKDHDEDRLIWAGVPTNSLLDGSRLPRPRFAYPPKLRVVKAPVGKRIVVWRRDARHYFHHLAIGGKWQKYLAGPPAEMSGRLVYPLCRTTPHGFRPFGGLCAGCHRPGN